MTNFWLSGAGGRFETKSVREKEYCCQNVGGQILDQEGSRQGGSGAMKCNA